MGPWTGWKRCVIPRILKDALPGPVINEPIEMAIKMPIEMPIEMAIKKARPV